MQLIVRCAVVLLALSSAVEAAGLRSLGRSVRGPPCNFQAAVCTVSAPVFSFGRHPMTGSTNPIFAQGSITVSCDKTLPQGAPVIVTIDLSGLPPNHPRQFASGQGAQLDYGIYLDPARTRAWGDGTRGTEAISDSLEMRGGIRNVSKTYLLYGLVSAGQPATEGNYVGAIAAEMRYGASCD